MLRRTQRSTRTETLFPKTTRFRYLVDTERRHHPDQEDRQQIQAEHQDRAEGRRTDDGEAVGPGRLQAAFAAPAHLVKPDGGDRAEDRSEEHTSELQSLMRISYAVFSLKKKRQTQPYSTQHPH